MIDLQIFTGQRIQLRSNWRWPGKRNFIEKSSSAFIATTALEDKMIECSSSVNLPCVASLCFEKRRGAPGRVRTPQPVANA
jgi:hypothetical protein